MNKRTSTGRNRQRLAMLAGRVKLDLWPSFLSELQIDPSVGQIDKVAVNIVAQAQFVGACEVCLLYTSDAADDRCKV